MVWCLFHRDYVGTRMAHLAYQNQSQPYLLNYKGFSHF